MFYIEVNNPYDFSQVYKHLELQENECLFTCENNTIYRAIKIAGMNVAFSVEWRGSLLVKSMKGEFSSLEEYELREFVGKWLGAENQLKDYYNFTVNDNLLSALNKKYHGLAVIGLPNLFEAFSWAIIGQQINLTFAHSVKRQFVEKFGKVFDWKGRKYFVFPEASDIVNLSIDELKSVQLSKQKAAYLIEVAKFMLETKIDLSKKSYNDLMQRFLAIKGIGSWTANYVLMKTFHFPQAFPHLDVGLHNAIKALRGLPKKPSAEEILAIGENWGEWKAYATFYLWRALADL